MSIKLRQLLYSEQESGISSCECPPNMQAHPSRSTPRHVLGEKCVVLASPVTHAYTCSHVAVAMTESAESHRIGRDGAAERLPWGRRPPRLRGRRALTATGWRPRIGRGMLLLPDSFLAPFIKTYSDQIILQSKVHPASNLQHKSKDNRTDFLTSSCLGLSQGRRGEGARGAPLGRLRQKLQVLLPGLEMVSWPLVRYPHGLSHKQPHGLYVVLEKTHQHTLTRLSRQRSFPCRFSRPVLWARGHVGTGQADSTAPHLLVHREAVVDPGGQNDQVPLLYPDANPPVLVVSHVKVPAAIQHVADLLVQV